MSKIFLFWNKNIFRSTTIFFFETKNIFMSNKIFFFETKNIFMSNKKNFFETKTFYGQNFSCETKNILITNKSVFFGTKLFSWNLSYYQGITDILYLRFQCILFDDKEEHRAKSPIWRLCYQFFCDPSEKKKHKRGQWKILAPHSPNDVWGQNGKKYFLVSGKMLGALLGITIRHHEKYNGPLAPFDPHIYVVSPQQSCDTEYQWSIFFLQWICWDPC